MGWIVGSFTGEALVQPSMAVSERLVGQEGRDEAIERAGRATADPVPVGVGITFTTTDQPADGRGQFLEDAVLVHLQGEDDVQSDVGGTDRAAVIPDQGLDLRVAGDVLEVQDEGVTVGIGDRDEDRAVGGGDIVAAVVVDLDGTVLGGVLKNRDRSAKPPKDARRWSRSGVTFRAPIGLGSGLKFTRRD